MSWLDGYGQAKPRPRTLAAIAATVDRDAADARKTSEHADTTWHRGSKRVRVEVVCCPRCGSTVVKISTKRKDGRVLMECADCEHTWTDERAHRLQRLTDDRRWRRVSRETGPN